MNEITRTLIYVVVAFVIVAGAVADIVLRPSSDVTPDEMLGKPLFESFQDPLEARSLEIVRFDTALGELHRFEVAQKNDRWVIPSHADYPADAENQLRDAATSMIGLNVIDVASDAAEDHKVFGVIEPNKDSKVGDDGVGVLVRMQDAKGKRLAQLIVGKRIKGAEDTRFVRIPGQSRVYTAKVDLDKLSTRFEDWIEKDLLKLNAFDIERITLKDYSVITAPTAQGLAVVGFDPRLQMDVSWNSEGGTWNLDKLLEFRGDKEVPTELLEDEELNSQRLDEMKTALDDLKIVDVRRKPKGLGADLRGDGNFMKDREGVQSLIARGFIPLQIGSNPVELRASNGEVHVGMKDGVEYILRFGNIAGAQEGSDEGKLNRYLFVTARVDENKFPEPQLEPLPDAPPVAPPVEADAPPPPVETPAEPAVESPAETLEGAEQPKPDAPLAEGEPCQVEPASDLPPAAPQASDDVGPQSNPQLQEERERVTRDNQRKIDQWKEGRKKADDRVRELNARFADWYYVISEDVYKKVHLGRADVVKEKEAGQDEGFGVDAFRKLEEDGLDAPPASEEPPPFPSGF